MNKGGVHDGAVWVFMFSSIRIDPETDLKTTKIELKAVQKKAIEGDRLIARFEGQLAVYEKIEAQKKMNE